MAAAFYLAVAFSLAGGANGAMAQATLRLDNFDKTLRVRKLISGWDSTKFSPAFGKGESFFFQFVNKGGEKFLHLKSGKNNSFSVGSKKEIEVADWPILAWDWKVTKTPTGGDVRVKEKDDQAGAVCVVIDPGLTSFDSSLCYIFENDGPKDQLLTSTKSDKAKYLILRTAKADKLGQWYSERRELLKDYERAFGRKPSKKGVVGVQIDSNDTESAAEAFYKNFVLSKK